MIYCAFHSYPNNNCYANYGSGTYQDPQLNFPSYLTHMAGVELCKDYLYSSALAQQHNKSFMMFETNTASCGGFPGISNSYGASLWALDYGMQMAHSNFSNALLHVGGQNVYYNVSFFVSESIDTSWLTRHSAFSPLHVSICPTAE